MAASLIPSEVGGGAGNLCDYLLSTIYYLPYALHCVLHQRATVNRVRPSSVGFGFKIENKTGNPLDARVRLR